MRLSQVEPVACPVAGTAKAERTPRLFCAPTLWRLLTINQPVGSRWNGVAPRSQPRFNLTAYQIEPEKAGSFRSLTK